MEQPKRMTRYYIATFHGNDCDGTEHMGNQPFTVTGLLSKNTIAEMRAKWCSEIQKKTGVKMSPGDCGLTFLYQLDSE